MGHYYTPEGEPKYRVPKKSGEGFKDTTINDAKELGLYPSVTEKIKGVISPSFGLVNWMINQPLDLAVKCSMAHSQGTNDEYGAAGKDLLNLYKGAPLTWKKRLQELAKTEQSKAPGLGADIHAAIESHLHWLNSGKKAIIRKPKPDIAPYIQSVREFIEAHSLCPEAGGVEKIVIDHETYTGGKLDFVGEGFGLKNVYLDWKTQKVRGGKPTCYFEWPLQLAFYAKADGRINNCHLVNVVIDTSSHPYTKNKPRLFYRIHENPMEKFGFFCKVSELYHAMNDWKIG